MRACPGFLALLLAACGANPPGDARERDPLVASVAPALVAEPAPPTPVFTPPSALDAKPAAVPMPAVPAPQKQARDARPAPGRDQQGELSRNGSVSGRLPEPGHRASFPFQSEPGEQSLFEIVGNGYSRASEGRVRMSIEEPSGKVAWQSERDVGAVWRDFAAFVPERPGPWVFSLTVLEGGYRFVLVRHSDYPALAEAPVELGARARVHGHLPNAESTASFLVPVSAGEELAVKVTGTREEARAEARRGATDMSAMVARMDSRRDVGRMAGGEKLQFQSFELEALDEGVSLGPLGPYLRLRAPRDGSIEIRIRARRPALGGGLFDLDLERPLQPLRVHGVVVDSEDQPLPDVEIEFLREPDADPVGRARTDAQGTYEASVLAGNLAVQLVHGQNAARQAVRVQVAADLELDLMFQPGARLRGR